MEPFGLFQILQNLLTPTASTEENVTSVNPPEPSPQKLDKHDFSSLTPKNAAAQFLENHEKRAGRTPSQKR